MTPELSKSFRLIDLPKWTLQYSIKLLDSDWVGISWEFFNDEDVAREHYKQHKLAGHMPVLRPYHDDIDRQNLAPFQQIRHSDSIIK